MDERNGGLLLLAFGVLRCAGLGLVAGGLEALLSSALGPAGPTAGERVVHGLVALGADAVLAALVGVSIGLVTVSPRSFEEVPIRVGRQLAGTALVLAGLAVAEPAWVLLGEGRVPGALVLGVLPALAAALVYLNARLWLRRAERGEAAPPWVAVALGVGLLGVAGSVAFGALREPIATADRAGSVVLVTVDGLRTDDVGASTPALEQLAAEGIVFEDAITPVPSPRPALAAALVGVHPLRLGVLGPEDPVARGWRTAPEALAAGGLVTAAFLSSVGPRSGLWQGFQVVREAAPAWARPLLLRALVGGGSRDALATVAAFEEWLPGSAARPFVAWVQVSDPAAADEVVGRIRAALEAAGALERTTVVFLSTHGVLRGEHGGQGAVSLYDEVVRVPLVIRTPDRPRVGRVDAQVRLTDVAPTLLEAARLDRLDEGEGTPLLAYGSGLRKATMWTSLVGVDLDGSVLIGLRNNGVKYVLHADGREELYDVREDPGETRDIGAEQPRTLEGARQLLGPDRKALGE